MGGSIYYQPTDPGLGAVVKGAKIGFRLGFVTRNEVTIDTAVFKDLADRAQFGVLVVDDVSEGSLRLLFDLYDNEGKLVASGSRSLPVGSSTDLNGDTLDDVSFRKPATPREGLERAVYLEFLSSKETLNTAMFSVIADQYSNGDYPNGVIGVNPDGRFIVAKYSGGSSHRSLVASARTGDVVLDQTSGSYQIVKAGVRGRSATVIDDADLEPLDASFEQDYFFRQEQFAVASGPFSLAAALRELGVGDATLTAGDDLEFLNALLQQPEMLAWLRDAMPLPFDEASIQQVLEEAPQMAVEELVGGNRKILELLFPDLCPVVNLVENPIAEIFPLLSCLIYNPDADAEEPVAEARGARSIATTSNEEYEDKAKAIRKKWSKYHSFFVIKNDKLAAEVEKALKSFGETSPRGTSGPVTLTTAENIEKASKMTETEAAAARLFETFANGVPKDSPYDFLKDIAEAKWGDLLEPETADLLRYDYGAFGYFSCTWGSNIEAGVSIATLVTMDLSHRVGSFTQNNQEAWTVQEWPLLEVTGPLVTSMPFIYGPVTMKLSLWGGFKAPFKVGFQGNIGSGFRTAFTGLFGFEEYLGADYAVKWKTKVWKVLGVRFSTPYPTMSVSGYGKVGPIAEMAIRTSPTGWMALQPRDTVASATISASITPTVFLQPRIIFNDFFWMGVKAELGEELGASVTAEVRKDVIPHFSGKLFAIPHAGLAASGGINIVIPVIDKRWEWTSPELTVSLDSYLKDFILEASWPQSEKK